MYYIYPYYLNKMVGETKMDRYLEAGKPFIISTSVGIIIILLFGMDKPNFAPIASEKEKTILLK